MSSVLEIRPLTRVEGHGSIKVFFAGTKVEKVSLSLYESPRFFEALLKGKSYAEVPEIICRICSLCSTEWEFRRLLCPHCGEEDKEKIPIYTAQQFPYIRLEACDTCHTYMKAVDLTKNGLAVPEVDELASLALDLWASEKGYTKLQLNLLGW